MRVAILDDELLYHNKIIALIDNYDKSIQVISFFDAKSLLEYDKAIDLLLLDIEMPDKNGIDFARENRSKFPCIIYITSHEECVFDCFDVNVIGFVVKHNMDENLIANIEKYKNRTQCIVTISLELGEIKINTNRIMYFKIEDSILTMQTTTSRYVLTERTLKNIFDKLDQNMFCFVNRQCLINVKQIHKLYRSKHEIIMNDMFRICVSKRQWATVLEHIIKGDSV